MCECEVNKAVKTILFAPEKGWVFHSLPSGSPWNLWTRFCSQLSKSLAISLFRELLAYVVIDGEHYDDIRNILPFHRR